MLLISLKSAMASSTTGFWPVNAMTHRLNPDDIDDHFMIKVLGKEDSVLTSWDHYIKIGYLDASIGNLPSLFRDLRSDQAGHIFARVHSEGNKDISTRHFGFFYPAKFDLGDATLFNRNAWGNSYDCDFVSISEATRANVCTMAQLATE